MGRRKSTEQQLPPRMRQRHGAYYHATRVDGRERWQRLSDDLAEAYREYYRLEGLQPAGETVEHAITRYRAEVLPGKAPATQREYARLLDILAPVFGASRLDEVRRRHIGQYLDRRSARVQGNREVAVLSSVYQAAIRWGWCDENPCRGAPRNSERPRTRLPTDAELAALRLAAGPQLRAMMDVTLLTALRRGDMLSLRVADVRQDGLHLTVAKTGRPVVFGRSKALDEALAAALALPRRTGCPWLFSNRRGQRITEHGQSTVWQRARAKAGVAGVTWHDLRRYVITLAQAQHGLDYAQAIGAHRSRTATERYVVEQALRIRPLR